ncbi:MAG: glutamate racemase [Candidatus Saccharimonadales bacterium]
MKLGVFDSGIGGEAVAAALAVTFPAAEISTVNDKPNVPYGSKSPERVRTLTEAAIQPLLQQSCDVIILACNTATAHAIDYLRSRYPAQKFIGIEPMIKTASTATTSGVIAVCATPATLASERYHTLKTAYSQALTVLEPDCSDWAERIEQNTLNETHIKNVINPLLAQGADVIVLGCTHYHWIKDVIVDLANGQAIVLEPSEAIGRRVTALLQAA